MSSEFSKLKRKGKEANAQGVYLTYLQTAIRGVFLGVFNFEYQYFFGGYWLLYVGAVILCC